MLRVGRANQIKRRRRMNDLSAVQAESAKIVAARKKKNAAKKTASASGTSSGSKNEAKLSKLFQQEEFQKAMAQVKGNRFGLLDYRFEEDEAWGEYLPHIRRLIHTGRIAPGSSTRSTHA